MRYELSDVEWTAIKPMLPNRPRGAGFSMASSGSRFALVNLAAVAQVWVVSVGLARFVFPAIGFTWSADTVAHVIGVAIPVFTSYLGHKHFSFAAKG